MYDNWIERKAQLKQKKKTKNNNLNLTNFETTSVYFWNHSFAVEHWIDAKGSGWATCSMMHFCRTTRKSSHTDEWSVWGVWKAVPLEHLNDICKSLCHHFGHWIEGFFILFMISIKNIYMKTNKKI